MSSRFSKDMKCLHNNGLGEVALRMTKLKNEHAKMRRQAKLYNAPDAPTFGPSVPLIECINNLKFGRPALAQKQLAWFIQILEAQK